MSFDPIKDAEQAGERVADHIGQGLPGVVDAVIETLDDREIVITIPAITIRIGAVKKA